MSEVGTTTHPGSSPPTGTGPRWRVIVTLAVVAVVAVVTLVWFEPQRLLFDTVVDDAFPTTSGSPAPSDGTEAGDAADDGAADAEPTDRTPTDDPTEAADADVDAPTGPVALASGDFTSRNRYTVEGTARVFELEDGARILRLEDFTSTNGPDLRVLLVEAGAGDDDAAYGAASFDLGPLRGNVGDQNYDIPVEVDLARYDRVIIWCERFTSSFGVANLTTG